MIVIYRYIYYDFVFIYETIKYLIMRKFVGGKNKVILVVGSS